MRRALALRPGRAVGPHKAAPALACAGALLAAGLPGAAFARPQASAAAARYFQVVEVEYRLTLSRGVVRAGAVGLETIDRGGDPHDLRLRRRGSHRVLAAPLLAPGRRADLVVHLRPGVYRLWCSLPEHARLGMRATLRVVR